MGKSHRDNVKARKKQAKRGGSDPYAKRQKRCNPKLQKCNVCGGNVKPSRLTDGLCKMCLDKYGGTDQ